MPTNQSQQKTQNHQELSPQAFPSPGETMIKF